MTALTKQQWWDTKRIKQLVKKHERLQKKKTKNIKCPKCNKKKIKYLRTWKINDYWCSGGHNFIIYEEMEETK